MKKGIRGITLIALVVTIVILLILAGVSINLVIGNNGIIAKAGEAKNSSIIGKEKEQIELARASVLTSKNGDSSITAREMQEELTNMGAKVEVTPAGKNITIKYTDTNHGYSLERTGEVTEKIETPITDVWYKISDDKKTIYFNNTESDGYKKVEEYDENNLTEWAGVWNSSTFTYESDITTAVFENKISPTSTAYWFNQCGNLTTIDNIENLDTSNVTSMEATFSSCTSLKTLDVSNFDTSNVTNMESMFYGCSSMTILDVSNFDTSNVTNMALMFSWCDSLTSLDLSGFNTINVTDMSEMFADCSELKTLDVSNFNTKNVTTMDDMFFDCLSLTALDVSHFDTSNVTSMWSMFDYCSSLTTLDVSNFDTSNVTNMCAMFEGCSNLTNLDVSNFNTSNATTIRDMFGTCTNLTTLDLSNFDTSNVTDMTDLFDRCSSLTNLDLSNFNTSKVSDMSYMFTECHNLTTIYVKPFDESNNTGWTTSFVNSSRDMFKDATNIVGGNGTTYNSSYIDKTYARIDTADTPGYLTSKQ